MNLYLLINRELKWGSLNQYDRCIVAAKTPEDAIQIHPDPNYPHSDWRKWCEPEQVQCTLIGHAMAGTVAGIILASFNAG